MLSTRQVAQRLGVSERQVLRYIHAGLLAAEQLGTAPNAPWMIHAASLEQFLAHRQPRLARQPTHAPTQPIQE